MDRNGTNAALDAEMDRIAADLRNGYRPAKKFAKAEDVWDAAEKLERGEFVDVETGSNEPPPEASRMKLTRLASVKPQHVDHLWPGRFPLGKLSIVCGMPGEGKTWLMLDIASRVSLGRPWPDARDGTNPSGRVLILTAEDGLADTIVPRLMAHDADLTRIDAIEAVGEVDKSGDRSFDLQQDIMLLDRTLLELGDVRAIIVDPLDSYMGGGRIDTHKNADVRRVLEPLCKLAERRNVAVLGVAHLNKSASPKALFRLCGSIGYSAAARAVWFVVKDENDPARRMLLAGKYNLGRAAPGIAYTIDNGRVEWFEGEVTTTADEILGEQGEAGESQSCIDEAMTYLREALKDGAVRSAEISEGAKQLDISASTLKRAKARLRVEATASYASGKTVWFLSLPLDTHGRDGPDDPHGRRVGHVDHIDHEVFPRVRAREDVNGGTNGE